MEDYILYALLSNPGVEAAYQRWRADAQRAVQVVALPDPQVSVGYFLEEVETRVGPQEYRVGVRQTFPWPGTLAARENAAQSRAMATWRRFESVQLTVIQQVVTVLHDLRYLDRAIDITSANLEIVRSFEQAVRARYRVGAGSHPEVIRVQVELGELEDRLARLRALRPSHVADVNAVLGRPPAAPVERAPEISDRVVQAELADLVARATEINPKLRALDDEVEAARLSERVARKKGLPDFTVGLDYTFTGSADMPGTRGSGDDPILLTVGIGLPIWRGKVDAAENEAIARGRAAAHERREQANLLASALHRAWFEHTDAHRRLQLFEKTLIPKAEESLQASLAGFRTGEVSFLDLLDTERTLLEFAISAERARADSGKALARLQTLVGERLKTRDDEEVDE